MTPPLVIKPVDSNSSKGVSLVTSYSDLQKKFENSKKFSRCGRVIVEEFIPGPEFSLDAFIDADGSPSLLLLTQSLKNHGRMADSPLLRAFMNPTYRSHCRRVFKRCL